MAGNETNYQFGDWLIELRLNRVRRDGEIRHLEPLAMNVLEHLLEIAGQVVAPDDLLDRFWRGRNAEPGMVVRCVSQIRTALSDDPRNPAYIETMSRRYVNSSRAIDR